MLLFVIVGCEASTLLVMSFADKLWQFYVVSAFNSFGYCKYSVVRSLLSKSFEEDEIGKVFSVLAVIAALAPVAGNPIYRQLYNSTLKTFPGAIFLLASCMMLVACLGNFIVYMKRQHLAPMVEEEEKKKEENKISVEKF
jgi:PCFT/HCP family folate transporter-like MFS transporter 1/3